MEALAWTLFFIVAIPAVAFLLLTWWLESNYQRTLKAGGTFPAPQAAVREQPAELPAGYCPRWNVDRRAGVILEHRQWQEDFSDARRAGGLHQ